MGFKVSKILEYIFYMMVDWEKRDCENYGVEWVYPPEIKGYS